MRLITVVIGCVMLVACAKDNQSALDKVSNDSPSIGQHHWVQVPPPDGCTVKQVAGDHAGGIILCEDGRMFH